MSQKVLFWLPLALVGLSVIGCASKDEDTIEISAEVPEITEAEIEFDSAVETASVPTPVVGNDDNRDYRKIEKADYTPKLTYETTSSLYLGFTFHNLEKNQVKILCCDLHLTNKDKKEIYQLANEATWYSQMGLDDKVYDYFGCSYTVPTVTLDKVRHYYLRVQGVVFINP